MTRILLKEKNHLKILETKKPVMFQNRELSKIDLSETTANKEFCEITFKNGTSHLVKQHKLDLKEMMNNGSRV